MKESVKEGLLGTTWLPRYFQTRYSEGLLEYLKWMHLKGHLDTCKRNIKKDYLDTCTRDTWKTTTIGW